MKNWVDESNAHRTRPASITVWLYANGQRLDATPTWSNTRSDSWSYTFTGLPEVDESGAPIAYTVSEETVSGYMTTVSGLTITNTLISREVRNFIDITGSKTWVDNYNAGNRRPGYISVRLLRDGEEVDRRTVTAGNDWSYTFTDQPADDGYGNAYTYTVREDTVAGYVARTSGYNLTNILIPTQTPENGDVPKSPDEPVNRNTTTSVPPFADETEDELLELLDLFDYDTPLWGGLLGTGDETPVWPYAFGGAGALALIALAALTIIGRRRRGKASR